MLNNAKRNKISRMLCTRSSVNSIVDSLRVYHATVFQVKKMMEGKSIKCVLRMEDIAKALKEDLKKSRCSLAKEYFLAPTTMPKIVKDARGKSKAIVKKPLLLEKTWAIQKICLTTSSTPRTASSSFQTRRHL